MSPREPQKPPQGGGELSGLLRHAEALHDLQSEVVEGQDAQRLVTVRLTGDGGAKEILLHVEGLREPERRALENALQVATRLALERLFELRKKRATAVTKGLSLPGLFL